MLRENLDQLVDQPTEEALHISLPSGFILPDELPESPIGPTIRSWREYREMTQEQLSKSVGKPIDKFYISKLEKGVPPNYFS